MSRQAAAGGDAGWLVTLARFCFIPLVRACICPGGGLMKLRGWISMKRFMPAIEIANAFVKRVSGRWVCSLIVLLAATSLGRAQVFRMRLSSNSGHSAHQERLSASNTPAWTFFSVSTPDTGLLWASVVYDQATNIMVVFGGGDAGLGGNTTNAVLSLTYANGLGGTSNWN